MIALYLSAHTAENAGRGIFTRERKRSSEGDEAQAGEGISCESKAPRERTREHTEMYVTAVRERSNAAIARKTESDRLRLYGQANKRTRWMPGRQEAMKDVVACEKLRGAGKQALIRRCPNGETHRFGGVLV